MCSRGGYAKPYVQWGRTQCSNGHLTEYSGVVMGSFYTRYRSEHLCVDPEREIHSRSDDHAHYAAWLFTTEIGLGLPADKYPQYREVACATCLPPLSSGAVYTRWGARTCPSSAALLYEGYMAGGGGGYNFVCLHSDAQHPAGYSDKFELGDTLNGVQYASTGIIFTDSDGYAACGVCQPTDGAVDVYTQWGRTSCSNGHRTEYSGLVMSQYYSHSYKTEENVCVDNARDRRHDNTSALGPIQFLPRLYASEMRGGSSDEALYPTNREVACAVCSIRSPLAPPKQPAAPPPPPAPVPPSPCQTPDCTNGVVYTRWGSHSCTNGATTLYAGLIAGKHFRHYGGGANYVCLHSMRAQEGHRHSILAIDRKPSSPHDPDAAATERI